MTIFFSKTVIHALVKLKRRFFPGIHPNRFKWFERLYIQLLRKGRSSSAIIDGHTIHLDHGDSLMLSIFGDFEVSETALFKKMVKPGDHVVDLGANIGYYTLLFAKAAGPEGHVHAFEPDPENYKILCRNIRENGYGNVSLHNIAASDRKGGTSLYLSTDNAGDHRIFPSGENRNRITVPTDTVDNMLGELASGINVIKMDIQGAEPLALSGMKQTCSNRDVFMLTEFSPMHLDNAGVSGRKFLDDLLKAGFTLYRLDGNGNPASRLPEPELLLEELTVKNRKFINILCTKGKYDKISTLAHFTDRD